MTIVEFFEKTPFENMISCLATRPKKVIFLGRELQMKEPIKRYRNFLKEKHINTVLEPRDIDENNLQSILTTITNIIQTEKDCIFDITGGSDLMVLGCGIVFATYRDKYPFKIQKFDLDTGKIVDCDCDNEVSFKGVFSVTVEEMVSLYGGLVLPENPQPDQNADKWDVDSLWEMARDNFDLWNDSVKYLKEFESRTQPNFDKININLRLATLVTSGIAYYNRKMRMYKDFLEKLRENGSISGLVVNDERISYSYKNAVVRRCLNSPGDILEMKVLFEGRHLYKNGKPFFDSCYIGVNIDWDGENRKRNDARNEIDVILMHAITPIFISCKIGAIDEVEPYKLWTVAERFGGKLVKKVLIASDFDRNSVGSELSFRNRLTEMGITFIPNAKDLSPSEWKSKLEALISQN